MALVCSAALLIALAATPEVELPELPKIEYQRVTVLDLDEAGRVDPSDPSTGVIVLVKRRPRFESMVQGRGGHALPPRGPRRQ